MGKVKVEFSLPIAILGAVIVTACNLPGSTLIPIFGTLITAGTFLFPLTFILFDLNTYFYGPTSTQKIILYIVYSQILLFLITFGISYVGHTDIYSMSLRVIIGSVITFFGSSFTDTYIFSKINEKLNKKKLWFSVNFSSILGQIFDTAMFSLIVFVGILPYDQIIKSGMLIFLMKTLSGILLTPCLYPIKYMIEKTKN